MSPEVHTLTGAYVLDALNAAERDDFERHAAACAECDREVAELRATAARLGSAAAMSPPVRLRTSVFAEVARTRQDSPRGLRLVGSDRPANRRRNWILWSASLVAAVALLAAGVLAGVEINTHDALQTAETQLSREQSQNAPVTELLAAPDVRTATDSVDGGSVTVLSSKMLGTSVLVTSNLLSQPDNRTYQAWAISDSAVRSLGVLGTGGSATLTAHLGDARTIDITVEPSGGSPKPTTVPIMTFPAPE
jgi:anti-sigma-K factor RskA